MNILRSFFRVSTLLLVSVVAMYLLFGTECDKNEISWYLHVYFDKGLSVLLFVLLYRLYRRWCKIDPWLIAYEKMCREVDEKPNPMKLNSGEV